jgi:CRISPR-associated endonuclease Csy4
MMKYYTEITLLPQPEIPLYFLWEKVYQQVHLALVERQKEDGKVTIGAAFPGYDGEQFQLGAKLRLFADSKQDLEDLSLPKWLARLTDYIHITSIKDVPTGCDFAVFRRLQPQGNNARLARRKAKREGISLDEAMAYFNTRKEQISKAPFIHAKSLSSNKRYRLLIGCESTEQSCPGSFSTYGLSSSSTVPVF